MQFAERYRRVVESVLSRPLTPTDGIHESRIRDKMTQLDFPLPEALVDYYQVLGGLDSLNRGHNRLIPWAQLGTIWEGLQSNLEPTPAGAACLIFLDENQRVLSWGLQRDDLPHPDPPVFQVTDLGDVYPEDLSVSEFLVMMIYLQAVWGGLEYNLEPTEFDEDQEIDTDEVLQRVRQEWTEVVNHDGLCIWQKNGMLISELSGDNLLGVTNNPAELDEFRKLGFA